MLNEICGYMKNWFSDDSDKHFGTFKIENGKIMPLDFVQPGQYFRIVGSVFNDGIYCNDDTLQLIDEVFSDGAVWSMRIPKEIIDLDAEITAWMEKNADTLASPYSSESFGGYSYTKASGSNNSGYTWINAFRKRLERWKKI